LRDGHIKVMDFDHIPELSREKSRISALRIVLVIVLDGSTG
jgi:hypothetical protein